MGDDVSRRLRAIEDRQAIEELRATYCFLVDDGRLAELVDEHFTEDAVCDFRTVRGAEKLAFLSRGRDEVRAFFTQAVPAVLADMCHMTHDHRIAIDGDHASGDCTFEVTGRDPTSDEPIVGAGRYVDRYRRVEGRWRFAARTAEIYYMSPMGAGWVKRPIGPALLAAAAASTSTPAAG